MASAWGLAFGSAWGNSWGSIAVAEQAGGGKSKRKQADYDQAYQAALRIKRERERIKAAIIAVKQDKPIPETVLSKPEIEQLALIESPIDTQRAIEFELTRLYMEWIGEYRKDYAIRLLLLLS